MNLKVVELDEDVEDIGYVEGNTFYKTVNKPSLTVNKPLVNRQIPKSVPNKPSAMQIEKPEKKQISYDDILSSLNMTVVNGKLQIKRADSQALEKQKQQQQVNSMVQGPPPKPLTREEYKQQLARQYLQKQSVKESKSKKLMFSNAEISVSPLTMNQNTNHLFKFIGSK
jgi:hypothetical protein